MMNYDSFFWTVGFVTSVTIFSFGIAIGAYFLWKGVSVAVREFKSNLLREMAE